MEGDKNEIILCIHRFFLVFLLFQICYKTGLIKAIKPKYRRSDVQKAEKSVVDDGSCHFEKEILPMLNSL